MGLEFTHIADREGAALYILYGGSTAQQKQFNDLKLAVESRSSYQVVVIDVNTPDGENVRNFYDFHLEQLPVAFVVRDDDSIAEQWLGSDIPTNPNDAVYFLEHAGNT